ncbi:efflux RND transporter periplasmic adaptor subunit [Roseospira marina]|uniref:Efflux RND transporter periplasmic adaptor subunit n=1 Tax=Roseospira marina TaxID=140057 RepID=A0A5M6ID76_9PROT|nr:efflux RND transporter periplasmic adaptor subunit [Roseospira marina]KAA5606022.1 efflux RND transporter periplasmic adaptor subunit [Roseospira marina]MBB4313120.1 membrane fusion protein (multidrug efflux system) [Roseospira marina]MBB5086139.1 membrane fusion protein (multidrug efflux system) [Roseospira marina]
MTQFRHSPIAVAILLLFVTVTGARAQAPQGEQPPQAVTVVTLKAQDVTLTADLPGRVVASRTAEVRPQVDGIIMERLFEEGSEVTVGQPLYLIDPATYEARVAAATAQVTQAQATLKAAERDANRQADLVKQRVASVRTYDEAVAARDEAEAAVQVAQADLKSAEIQLERTTIKAPIDGVIGRSLTTQGALVTNGQAQALAIIRAIDQVQVDVTQSAAEILAWRRGLMSARLKEKPHAVSLILADGSRYEATGSLEAAEPYVNEQTGVVTLRLEFPNPDHLLLPGMYVRVLMPQGIVEDVVLAPQRGVSYDRRGRPVAMVVNADNVVEERVLDIVEDRGSDWIVGGGLNDGDRIIVAGLQKVSPGATVAPEEQAAESSDASAAEQPSDGSSDESAADDSSAPAQP